MKHGTILRDLYQSKHDSLFVYMGVSGKYAKCFRVVDGEFFGVYDLLKKDILNDREHYPIVGHVNIAKVICQAAANDKKIPETMKDEKTTMKDETSEMENERD